VGGCLGQHGACVTPASLSVTGFAPRRCQVVPSLPLSGRWPGVTCFAFKRRQPREADVHALKAVRGLARCAVLLL
jgi:hypothetical protein